jgi:hypothetical protein
MCVTEGASAAMVAAGVVAMAVTARRGMPVAVPAALDYFAVMEALQVAGYRVIDQCGTPANEAVTLLSILTSSSSRWSSTRSPWRSSRTGCGWRCRRWSTVSACSPRCLPALRRGMPVQIYPLDWAGPCRPGDALCGEVLCTTSGDWHLAWTIPFNGLLVPFDAALGTRFAFPTYILAVFVVPVAYGAWRSRCSTPWSGLSSRSSSRASRTRCRRSGAFSPSRSSSSASTRGCGVSSRCIGRARRADGRDGGGRR